MSSTRGPRSRAQSFVEFALILPIVLLLLGGGADLARVYFMGIETSNGAAQAALYVANQTSDSSPPTFISSSQLRSIVLASYGGSLLSCPSVAVRQSESQAQPPVYPSGNSTSYPTSGSFYELVTVTCKFTPLTPFLPVSLSLVAASSAYVVEPS